MRSTYLAGAGLGLVAAVVFASSTMGPLVARFILMFITPLPIALAGLGWGWRSAVLAGAVGSAIVLAVSSPTVALAFALTQAVPMVLLTYLALLNRPLCEKDVVTLWNIVNAPLVLLLSTPQAIISFFRAMYSFFRHGEEDPHRLPNPDSVAWYPAGRLVIWSAVLAGAMAISLLMLVGGDLDTLRKALAEFVKSAIEAGLPTGDGTTQLSEAEVASLSEIALSVLPAASAMSWMTSLVFNLWLAGRITLASGQLGRPWPDLAAITYPPGTPLAFGALLFATTLSGYAGLAASAFAGGLFVAYLMLGLAIVHYTTRGQTWRPFALWLLYGALFVVNIWIGIIIAMLGLAEAVLNFRARSGAPPGTPPTPPTPTNT